MLAQVRAAKRRVLPLDEFLMATGNAHQSEYAFGPDGAEQQWEREWLDSLPRPRVDRRSHFTTEDQRLKIELDRAQ